MSKIFYLVGIDQYQLFKSPITKILESWRAAALPPPLIGVPIKHHYSIYLVDCNSVSENDFGFRSCFPYGIDEGPCIFDDQCKDNLFCGYKNCPASFGNDSNCCGRNQFKSPNYPNNYFPNDIKTWHITASFGSKINLQFDSFHVRLIGEYKNKKSTIYIS